jgi:LPS export ABC transporter protein LptC
MTLKNTFNTPIIRKSLYTAGIIWFIVLLIIYIKPPDLTPIIYEKKNTPDFEFETVRISQLNGELVEWQLTAKKALIYKKDGVLSLSSVNGSLYNDNEKQLDFISPKALYFENDSNLFLQKTTLLLSGTTPKTFVKCNALQFKGESKQFIGKGKVTLITSDIKITGNKLVADITKNKLSISKKAIAEIYINE